MGADLPRIAVVGCGYWGSKHLRAIHESRDASLVMAVDQSQERRDYVRSRYPGVEVVSDLETALASDVVDGVVIATPISTHYKLARLALMAGKHVLVEKPMATTAEHCESLIALAEVRELALMVGHTYEYHPAITYLRNAIRSGKLGSIHYINSARLNLGLFQPDANVLWDLAPHDLSIIFSLLDQPAMSLSATGHSHIIPGIEDVVYADVAFASGISAHIHVSWLDPCKVRQLTVVGSEGMAVFDDTAVSEKVQLFDKRFTVAPAGDRYADFQSGYHYGDVLLPKISGAEPLSLECQDFAHAIATGERPIADGHSGLRVVRALECAERSIRSGLRELVARPVVIHQTSHSYSEATAGSAYDAVDE